ncbi:hypothetical protein ACLOJK_002276 [Asimina triloba]
MRIATTRFYKSSFDYTQLLRDCTSEKTLRVIHGQIISSGFQSNPFLASKLVSRYVEHGRSGMKDARQVFEGVGERDVLLWNVVIRGYASSGPFVEAVQVYGKMQQSGVWPNRYTFPFLLKACAAMEDGRTGRTIHGHVLTAGLGSDLFVGNALIAFYAKCGQIGAAKKLFVEIPEKDLVSWNSMIAGYSQNECTVEALQLFRCMLGTGALDTKTMPDRVTLVTVLPACAQASAIHEGMWIHLHTIKLDMKIDADLGSGLVYMYARCGRLKFARAIFDRMFERNVVVWNAMIGGYGVNGRAEEALQLFSEMVETGVQADEVCFISLLSACSHAGMVEKGLEMFERMGEYGVERNGGHYACMVDLLGRAGRLDEAIALIKSMPMKAEKGVWGALLGACRIHNNIRMAEEAAERLFELDPENAGRYVLLAKMYEEAGRWADAARVRRMMRERGVKKPLGCSGIEVDNAIHTFGVEDEGHWMSSSIYDTLETLERVMEMET